MLKLLSTKSTLVAVLGLSIFTFSSTVSANTNYYATGGKAPTILETEATTDKSEKK